MPRAIISVSDKRGLTELGATLTRIGWDIVASGGTARVLQDAGFDVTPVEQLTALPEMLGGRVKTLHPAVHGAILARDRSVDMAELQQHGYAPIDLVVCNLYPFQQTISDPTVQLADAIEQIDIGGVALIRAAAKNFERVTVVVDPDDYQLIQEKLTDHGIVELAVRRELAVKAFAHTRDYDTAIHGFLAEDNLLHGQLAAPQTAETPLPASFTLGMSLVQPLRYGENPHQPAGFYAATTTGKPLNGELLRGKALSYNNLLDADAAWQAAISFTNDPAVVIVKHMNPTGIAIGASVADAFPLALASDPVSAFGGVIAVNRVVTTDFVHALERLFVEVIIAPEFDEEAVELLAKGRKNCRLVRVPDTTPTPSLDFRSVLGGVLVQARDMGDPSTTTWEIATQRNPTPEETRALNFAWHCVQHTKSNAIVLAHPTHTVGVGGGLPSRVDAAELAVTKAGEAAQGAAMASDAFFPFADGIEAAVRAGVSAIIQPGGSIRDQEVIDAANAADVTMVLTKTRHFRH